MEIEGLEINWLLSYFRFFIDWSKIQNKDRINLLISSLKQFYSAQSFYRIETPLEQNGKF